MQNILWIGPVPGRMILSSALEGSLEEALEIRLPKAKKAKPAKFFLSNKRK
ncbi:MAG: hypothetical protein L0209_08680 [candidate division Zixibacteria bacterium]|nr:hypothetical protein [candidate division Zixibacteria bacterium]